MLEPLGVDDATFAVYHALLSHPDSTPEQIAELVKQPIAQVLDTMALLRKLELLVPTWADPDSEHAVHPRVGLSGLAERRRGELYQRLNELKQAESTAEVMPWTRNARGSVSRRLRDSSTTIDTRRLSAPEMQPAIDKINRLVRRR